MRHHVEIVANGQEGTNCAKGQVQFRTACGTGRLPLIEDFNDVTTDSMTPCWIRSVNFGDAFTLPRVVSFENGDKAQMLSCGNSNRSGHFGMVVTPKIVSGTQQWLVSFKLRVSHSGTRIVVGFCDSTSDETQSFGFQAVETLTFDGENVTFRNEIGTPVEFPRAGTRSFRVRMGEAPFYFVGGRLNDGGLQTCE
jgi:hypothetical protein